MTTYLRRTVQGNPPGTGLSALHAAPAEATRQCNYCAGAARVRFSWRRAGPGVRRPADTAGKVFVQEEGGVVGRNEGASGVVRGRSRSSRGWWLVPCRAGGVAATCRGPRTPRPPCRVAVRRTTVCRALADVPLASLISLRRRHPAGPGLAGASVKASSPPATERAIDRSTVIIIIGR